MLGRFSMIPLVLALGQIEVSPPGEKKKRVYIMHVKKNIAIAELARVAQLPVAKVLIPDPETEEPPGDLFPEAAKEKRQPKSKADLPWEGEKKEPGEQGEKSPLQEEDIPQVDPKLLQGWTIARSSLQELEITDRQLRKWFAHYNIEVGLADFAKALPRGDITHEMLSNLVSMLDAYKEKRTVEKAEGSVLD